MQRVAVMPPTPTPSSPALERIRRIARAKATDLAGDRSAVARERDRGGNRRRGECEEEEKGTHGKKTGQERNAFRQPA